MLFVKQLTTSIRSIRNQSITNTATRPCAQKLNEKKNEIGRKESDVENLRRRMNENFNSRINELKREKNYSGLDSWLPSQMINSVKEDMRRELDNEISRDRQELAEIDKMIARINELELQSRRE